MTNYGKMHPVALVATTLGPIVTFLGYTLGAMAWPGFDGMVRPVSDLAANDSPVQLWVSLVFLFGAVCDFLVAYFAKSLPMKARVVIFIAGLATIGLTVFPTPSQDTHSIPHRIFAITSFVLFSIWPLFAIRKDPEAPPLLRLKPAIWGTVFLVLVSAWFLSLWADKSTNIMGLGERIGIGVQGLYPMVVFWHTFLFERKRR
jgi:hypothetical protein